MCGISGIINKNNSPIIEKDIHSMNDLIIHRGPDSEGYFFGKNFAFGHRRLSIIDLTSDGAQPMDYLGKYKIIYNGEVYNYIELKDDLKKLGYKFNSSSDTEVILAAYAEWGSDCVKRFNGMWGFAIFDKVKNIIFCSRDRFGVKPFYFAEIDDKFVFGSEIKQLLGNLNKKKVNIPILMDFLVLGYSEHTSNTFFTGIKKLPQSHNLIYDLNTHTYRIEKYYELKFADKLSELNESDSIRSYMKVFSDSVKLRLRSDVKVGTCLSGGMDSSAISALGALGVKDTGNKFTAITASSSDPKNDETEYARKVADFCNLDWHTVKPDYNDFINLCETIASVQEEPFGGPSIFMQYFVFKTAHEQNCKVLLDGQGGDETLLGYVRYYTAYILSQPVIKMMKEFWRSSRNSNMSRTRLFLFMIYFLMARVRTIRQKKRSSYIKSEYLKQADYSILFETARSFRDIRKLQTLEIMSLQLPALLRFEDKNSMHHSVESRLPFIDYRVVETALSLPDKYKIFEGWTKYILRKGIETHLPADIVWRKNKIGFEAPADLWMNEYHDYIMEKINSSKILKKITDINKLESLDSDLKWKLFFMSIWEKKFDVTI